MDILSKQDIKNMLKTAVTTNDVIQLNILLNLVDIAEKLTPTKEEPKVVSKSGTNKAKATSKGKPTT